MTEPNTGTSRHHRQELLSAIGAEGQARLGSARVVIVGCGALGTVSAELLVRAGVGSIQLVDRDVVEVSNLQRQLLFDESDAAHRLPKAIAAARRLGAINSQIAIEPVVADLNPRSIERVINERPDVLIDGTDNFETRYLLNDLAVRDALAFIYAGAVGTEGRVMTILPHATGSRWAESLATPCLRCVFPDPPLPGSAASSATCDTVGVLGPITAVVASIQAGEAIKILVGDFGAVRRDMLHIDLWSGDIRSIDLKRSRRGTDSPDPCPACAGRRFPFLDGERGSAGATLCGRNAVQVEPTRSEAGASIELVALRDRLSPHGSFSASSYLVKGVLEREVGEKGRPIELTVFSDGRAIVGGTTKLDRARSVYAKYVGA